MTGQLFICRRTVGGNSKSEYGTRYYVYEEVAPYQGWQPIETAPYNLNIIVQNNVCAGEAINTGNGWMWRDTKGQQFLISPPPKHWMSFGDLPQPPKEKE